MLTKHKSVDKGANFGHSQDEPTNVESNQALDKGNTNTTKEQSHGTEDEDQLAAKSIQRNR